MYQPRGAFVPDQEVAELRGAPRYSLLLRVAKLACPAGEVPCIVRDISATGTRLRLFCDDDVGDHLFLELANGRRFAMERMWQDGGHAGFRFADAIDVESFVSEHGEFPKRAIRLRLSRPATVTADGEAVEASLSDLSQQGARIECETHLAIAQRLTLAVEGMPDRRAIVRWRRKGAYGLVFEETFTLEQLARLAFRL
jgi:hypothetical protein